MSSISTRKKDHVDLTTSQNSQYLRTTGLDGIQLRHNALPECSIDNIDTSAQLLGRTFPFPLFISSMTGGYDRATQMNAVIAEFCETLDLPFGVGSQRAMLEDSTLESSFTIARKKAPNAFIAANIGGVQLIGNLPNDKIRRMTESIEADAVIVHLNPLQELVQPEGDRDFLGVLSGIEHLASKVGIPIIVKETGAGIDAGAAKKLLNVGVSVIDVAGVGGTSWSKVEHARLMNADAKYGSSDYVNQYESDMYARLNEWGNSTRYCLESLQSLAWEREFQIIASGGIRHATHMIKARCLGAHFVAVAQPVVPIITHEGLDGLFRWYDLWKKETKMLMTLLGVTHWNLLGSHCIISGDS